MNTDQGNEKCEKRFIAHSDDRVLPLVLEDAVRLTYTTDGREHKILVLLNAPKCFLKCIKEYSFYVFICQAAQSGSWNCFPAVVSYGSYMSEVKYVCAANHVLSILRPFHRCLSRVEDFQIMTRRNVRHRSHNMQLYATFGEKVTDCKTMLKTVVGSRGIPYVHLDKKTIAFILKDYPFQIWTPIV